MDFKDFIITLNDRSGRNNNKVRAALSRWTEG